MEGLKRLMKRFDFALRRRESLVLYHGRLPHKNIQKFFNQYREKYLERKTDQQFPRTEEGDSGFEFRFFCCVVQERAKLRINGPTQDFGNKKTTETCGKHI